MTGPLAHVQQLPERFLGQVRDIVNDAELVQRADQRDAFGGQRPGRAGAAGVARALPGQADGRKPGVKPARHIVRRAIGVGAFQQDDRVDVGLTAVSPLLPEGRSAAARTIRIRPSASCF